MLRRIAINKAIQFGVLLCYIFFTVLSGGINASLPEEVTALTPQFIPNVRYEPDGNVQRIVYYRAMLSDEDGKWIEGSPFTWEWIYDSQGRLTHVRGTIEIALERDTAGRLVESRLFYSGVPQSRTVVVYDDDANVTYVTEYDGDGNLIMDTAFVFDTDGHLSSVFDEHSSQSMRVVTHGDGRFQTALGSDDAVIIEWKYNEDNLVSEVVDRRLLMKLSFSYDDRGNVTEKVTYPLDGPRLAANRYSYTYDFMGNWIEKTTFRWTGDDRFKPIYVTRREIEYAP